MKRLNLLFGSFGLVAIGATVATCAGSGGSDTGAGGSGGTGSGSAGIGVGVGGSSAGAGGTTGAGGSGTGGSGTGGSTAGAGGGSGAGGSGAWRCPAGSFTSPTVANLVVQRVTTTPPADSFSSSFSIVEGPVWIGDALYMSQILSGTPPPVSRILKLVPGSDPMVIAPNDGSNGLAVDSQGRMFAALHGDGTICQIPFDNPTGPIPYLLGYNGVRFNAPNDLAIRSDGIVYFSDPYTQQAPTPHPQAKERVYRGSLSTQEVTVVDETLSLPNGVTLSLDETALFVSGGSGLYRYPVNADGSVGTRAPFGGGSALSGSDGMTMDCAGNLYVTVNQNVVVISPAGTELGRLTLTGIQSVTNVAFGGADHKTLYITSLGSQTAAGLFTVAMPLPGMPY